MNAPLPTCIFTILLITFTLPVPAIAQNQNSLPELVAEEVDVKAEVSAVTLYLGRASVTRTAEINLQPGLYDLRFTDLPAAMQSNSLQARATGVVKVLGVEFEMRSTTGASSEHVAELDRKIEEVKRTLSANADEQELLIRQDKFIHAVLMAESKESKEDVGTTKLDLTALKDQVQFIAEEQGRLFKAKRELDYQKKQLDDDLRILQGERNSIAGRNNIERSAVVSVAITEPSTSTVELTYLVNNATWQPVYNIRADADGSTVAIEYDAMLTQRTGEDWKNVALTLSTAQPTLAANAPTIAPWFVDILKPQRMGQDMQRAGFSEKVELLADFSVGDRNKDNAVLGAELAAALRKRIGKFSADAQVSGGGPSITYQIPRAITVLTNARKQQRTRITTIDSQPKFVHVAVPLLTEAVYVRGEITNNSSYQLLPGAASIFVGTDYVGPTNLASVAPNVEFDVYFGIDQAIKATRRLVKKKTDSTGLLGGGRKISYDYRILVDNGTGKSVQLELWDRIPTSRTDEIQVQLIDLSHALSSDGGYLTDQRPTGLLCWDLGVPQTAKGSKSMALSYGVRINYAKDVKMTPLPE